MPPLPIPTQQPPRPQPLPYNPFVPQVQGQPQHPPPTPFGALGGGWPGLSDFASRQKAGLINTFNELYNKPIGPDVRGGAFLRDLQTLNSSLMSVPFGLTGLGWDAIGGFADAAGAAQTYFTGSGYRDPRLAELQPADVLPGGEDILREQLVRETANPGGIALPALDFTTTIQGLPIPEAPPSRAPTVASPDFRQADIRLDAAKPKQQVVSGDRLGSYLEGAGEAAASIDPYNDNWSAALAKVAAGGSAGVRALREKRENAELQYEADMRQYELMRAGIDAQRAAAESQLILERTKLEIAAENQEFQNKWRMFEALQPNIHANADGSMIVTTRKQDGTVNVERIGFEDALKNRIAVEQAKALGGKGAESAARLRLLQNAGPNYRVAEGVTQIIGEQQDSLLIPPGTPAYDAYVQGVAKDDQDLVTQGFKGKDLEAKMAESRFQRIMQLIYSNPQVRDHALQTMFGIEPQKPNPLPAAPKR